MDPRDRADETLARARARGAFVITPENATSPMDAASTVQIPRTMVSANDPVQQADDHDPTVVLRGRKQRGPYPGPPGARPPQGSPPPQGQPAQGQTLQGQVHPGPGHPQGQPQGHPQGHPQNGAGQPGPPPSHRPPPQNRNAQPHPPAQPGQSPLESTLPPWHNDSF